MWIALNQSCPDEIEKNARWCEAAFAKQSITIKVNTPSALPLAEHPGEKCQKSRLVNL